MTHRVPVGKMIRTTLRLLLLAAMLAALPGVPARAQGERPLRGVALVIGNGDYAHLPALANPGHDADAVETLLSRLGFDSVRRANRDAATLRRDLDRFVEDAAEADVAVLYYAGHGIEAGGENFLVPVDADPSALDAAGERLVPLSLVLARLRETVPVTILLLDACRDNPFPPGATLRLDATAEPVPVSAGGLAETRGARAIGEANAPSAENLGMVIGFAAEPGRPALDGTAGENSPYAAALLRHLDTMAGEEFGTVMRMVAEEVYLKTAGRQRPWVNESLRRLLYFGAAPEPVDGMEGEILGERRRLLLTIAALPDMERRQVERVAGDGGVPMDALYAMLSALGADIADDPARLERVLHDQAGRLREIMSERAALTAADPDIVRLASLAAAALDEGALRASLRLHEEAKARVEQLEGALDDVEAELRARRAEFAQVFAASAAAYELAFDYAQAASDYDRAFEQVARWDDGLAWEYRRKGMVARFRQGEYLGDVAVLEAVAASRDEALALAARLPSALPRAEALLQVGNALTLVGRQRSVAPPLEEAIAVYSEALSIFEAGGDTTGIARARSNLASALSTLGGWDPAPERLERAIAIYRELADEASFETAPRDWTTARLNLAAAMSRLGERSGDTTLMRAVAAIHQGTLERVAQADDPLLWALTRFNLGGALNFVGERDGEVKALVEAIESAEAAVEVLRRDAFPIYWASAMNNIANAYQILGKASADATILKAAEYHYRDALEEWRRDRVPSDWAMATNNLANVLKALGEIENDPARLEEAVAAYRSCMDVWTRADKPLDWGTAQNNLGDALFLIGRRDRDPAQLAEAIAAFDAALEEWTFERLPYDWAVAQNNRGGALVELGALQGSTEMIREGIAAIRAAWKFDTDSGIVDYDEYYRDRLSDAEEKLTEIENKK
jgi:uncharacterized caspase-like protein